LNEPQPNALSEPGGNVYVTTAMLSFLRNRDELAGVICHEVNHDIHHDMYNVYQATQRGTQPLAYERAAETQADRDGAYVCAKAGFNPWGMVWNMRMHRGMGQSQQMVAPSDHPSDDQRLADLTALLTRDTATFGKFKDDIAASVPLSNGHVFAQYPTQYPSQYPTQYPSQYPMQYPSQPQPQMGPYPPPPLPACYPGC
jgi:predicted Zn-dependent protease